MTKSRLFSLLTASALCASCLGVTAFADAAYAVGDVDMDGVITGHDTAMVSRYVLEEDYPLTEEQLTLADVDGDGEVTQADADKLFNEMQEYALGDNEWETSTGYLGISDASKAIEYFDYTMFNEPYEDMTEVQKNLSDIDLDGDVDMKDAKIILTLHAHLSNQLPDTNAERGIYYYSMDPESPAFYEAAEYEIGDVDMDGYRSDHDAAMVSRYLLEDDYTLTEQQLKLADIDEDGEVTQSDADRIYGSDNTRMFGDVKWVSGEMMVDIDDAVEVLTYYAYSGAGLAYDLHEVKFNIADVDLSGTVDLTDAVLMLTLYARQGAGLENTNAANGIYYYSDRPDSPAYMS